MSSIIALINNPAPDDSSNKKQLIKHSLIEFCATTVFIYFGTLSAISTGTKLGGGTGEGADVARVFPIAFSFGITIMCLVYSIGHITGGHMNPGVSFLMFLQLQISLTKMLAYWVAQLVGALVASSLVWASVTSLSTAEKGEDGTYNNPPFQLGSTSLDSKLTPGNGFLLELMGSFFFYFVISQTALDQNGIAKTSFPAIPIGFSLVVVHICLIPFTGCGVNPARVFGPAMITCMSEEGDCIGVVGDWWWIYYIGPFLAAFLVAEITALIHWDVDDGKYDAAKQADGEDQVED
jgi:aquaporin Z